LRTSTTQPTTLINGTLYIKILGDINGDDTVNFNDLVLLNQAFGSTASDPIPPWNPDADLNKDNIINIIDLYLLGKNHGRRS
jgi:hypothetical protein